MDADNMDDLDSAKFQERCQFPTATQGIGFVVVKFGHTHHSILRAKLQIIFRKIIILRQYN